MKFNTKNKLIEDIYKFNVYEDKQKVRRKNEFINWNAKVMIIGEALAEQQVRLSGINFFKIDGTIGNTGIRLETFLNKLNQTLYPKQSNTVYNTDIVLSFPGKNTPPSDAKIKNSVMSGILLREIEEVKPKLILLMGRKSYLAFYNNFLEIKHPLKITEEIFKITNTGKYHLFNNIPVFPIIHASGQASGDFPKNNLLIPIINKLLNK